MSGAVREPFGDLDPRAESVMVPMADGVRLATDVWLPPAPGRLPTILIRVPYDKLGSFASIPAAAEAFVAEGYAVVTQDVRGKIRSEGETFAFTHEVDDGAATLEWIVTQPWSDGVVGMFGDSYYGFTQWAAAASGHPALRAIVPRMTTTEVGSTWMFSQGVFQHFTMVDWASFTWIDEALWSGGVDWSVRPLIDILPTAHGGRRSASLDAWIRRAEDDPWWTDAVFAGRGNPRDAADVPTLGCGGWYDVFGGAQVRDFLARQGRFTDQHLEMGSRDHWDLELRPLGEPAPDAHDPAYLAAWIPEYVAPALQFFARHLRGQDVSLPKVRWHRTHDGWHGSPVWPPLGAQVSERGLAPGAIVDDRHAGGEMSWVHDPDDPVPSRIEDVWAACADLPDEAPLAERSDVVTFTGEELRAPLDLVGAQSVRLRLSTTGPSTHAVAQLVDVAPDGTGRRIVEGAALAGAEGDVEVDLAQCAYRLDTGHRLRLQVMSSLYPRYQLHPGTDEDPWTAVRTARTEQTLDLAHCALRLTVLDRPPAAP